MKVLPALSDNYIYVLEKGDTTVVIDPGEEIELDHVSAILLTHHHSDHIGGVSALIRKHGCPVYGPAGVKYVDHPVGDHISIGPFEFEVIETPGHTMTHVIYYLPKEKQLFTGDTLFLGGCGRLFEGTPEDMRISLDKILELPDDTKIYPGHNYTRKNLLFNLSIEPDNEAIKRRLEKISLPGTLAEEKKTNLLLMARDTAYFAELRQKRDSF